MNIDRKKSFMENPIGSSKNTIKGLQLFIADLRATQHSKDHEKRINYELVKIKKQFEPSTHPSNPSSSPSSSSSSSAPTTNSLKLDGYQRKKYVAKLAYIYITTNTSKLNELLFGLDQILNLINSNHYSEKFMGYLTLSLFFEHEKVITLINNTRLLQRLLSDLSANNDDFTSLALNFIGTVGNLHSNLSSNEEIVNKVFQIIRSPTSSQYLRKKSTLTFLSLLKNNLSILTDNFQRKQIWIQKIIALLDDTDNYRVTLTALPLIEYIATNVDPSYCFRIVPQLADILYTCIVLGTKDSGIYRFPTEYKFAKIPNPWLITKVVSLLNRLITPPYQEADPPKHTINKQCLHSSDLDPEILNKLRKCVVDAISLGNRETSDPMERIVQNTVLFSLIKFAPKLDPSNEAVINSVNTLCSLLQSSEINIKYLALDSLIQLCSDSGRVAIDTVSGKNLDLIVHLMNNEKDMSILRKTVDLLYTLANVNNVKVIVAHYLQFISNTKQSSDPQLKSNISIKIAVLIEKYATDPNWYIETSLKMLSLTPDNNSFHHDNSKDHLNDNNELWYRLCQIVVNNPQLRKLTCHNLLDYLVKRHTSEYIVKTSAFLLGQYPSLVTDQIPIIRLFSIFAEKYYTVSNMTKAMILTTMIQLYRHEPNLLGSDVIKIFQLELNSLDIELQTRAYEYLKIIQISKVSGDMTLINTIFETMPPFNTKSNPLLKRLGGLQQENNSTDSDIDFSKLAISNIMSSGDSSKDTENMDPSNTIPINMTMKQPPLEPFSRKGTTTGNNRTLLPIQEDNNHRTDIKELNNRYIQQRLASNWKEGFTRMLQHKQGVFYSSPLMKILYRITNIEPYQIKIGFTYINQTEWDITGLSTEFIAAYTENNPEYIFQNIESLTNSNIKPHKRVEQSVQVIIRKPFNIEECPLINVYFNCGGNSNHVTLKLGVAIISTMNKETATSNASTSVTLPQFITRWRTLGTALGKEAEYHVANILITNANETQKRNNSIESMLSILQTKLKRIGIDIIEQTNVSNTLFIAGIVHTKTDGNFGCLMKLQCQQDWKVNITCKTTLVGPLATYVVDCLRWIISN